MDCKRIAVEFSHSCTSGVQCPHNPHSPMKSSQHKAIDLVLFDGLYQSYCVMIS